ncbi:unnamed protein product [Adineta steineri]|uniref:Uncharacterized protein n=1 Tax=Adineta steineri TaxID=433720 RepID=A0A815AP94_9BILA|nr:unnamed protein product [Adineta steineri]CAF4061786.1 unnamed protein product [Adineta steineri]
MNRLILYNATLIIAGISTIVASFSGSHILSHISYASFFGFFSGVYIHLTSIITVDLPSEKFRSKNHDYFGL